ncbi:MAG TPA: AMP-binding protein [Ignavibacteriaceae bacterium]|nr:AMP-binding protein [Ignavibacteriaceae bacterium]
MNKKFSDYKNIWERFEENILTIPDKAAITHWVAGERPVHLSFSELFRRANLFSKYLKSIGIKQGNVCALIIRHNINFFPLYYGVMGIGAIPAVLAYPNPRLHPDKFRQGIEGMSQRSGLDYILTEKDLEEIIKPLVIREGTTIKGLFYPFEENVLSGTITEEELNEFKEFRQSLNPSDPLLLQHSSGTTGLQKPVLLSHKAVLLHVENMAESLKMTSNDKIVSWLPLYHDMGLIAAFHLPIVFGITTVQIDPFEWVLVPVILLEAITSEKGTITWQPNFAYNLMADKIRDEDLFDVNLKSLRLSISCSEPVRFESNQKFIEKFAHYGLQKNVLSASYAMAETTFGVTQVPPGEEIWALSVVRDSFAKGIIRIAENDEPYRICSSSGKLIPGCEVKIVDENREQLQDGVLGEVAIKSVSMFDGYRNYPEKTAEVLSGDWYYSGDIGFKWEEDFFIVGRKKDLIIVAGVNVYPEDVEDAVGKVDGVVPGRVISFGQYAEELGTEVISVIAETKLSAEEERKSLKKNIVAAGMAIDVMIYNVYLVPPRWLIKSSAGKPSRKASSERIQDIEEQKKWIVK